MKISTGTGDDGTTALLNGERVGKDHLELEVYGSLDESLAAVEFAGSLVGDEQTKKTLAITVAGLRKVYAQLANEVCAGKLDEADLTRLDEQIENLEQHLEIPGAWASFEVNTAAAALNFARAVVRRAERRLVEILKARAQSGPVALAYLNRISDLLYLLALSEKKK